ncbi:solute carrier family 2, facilitated glucose transporter member 1 [Strongylocentrotus purpuratus]|uniref:Major facilitator superfamily (MFS) profile domain-containing protein n=1 Tax=Strongylocentrotus purpuratus TaxID=7668 RepID=A0A7M7SZN0_STRPU|nr:solute carrier family 2, facilitated glucose transporter member 1 [Strongylocentrotus purpuratus]
MACAAPTALAESEPANENVPLLTEYPAYDRPALGKMTTKEPLELSGSNGHRNDSEMESPKPGKVTGTLALACAAAVCGSSLQFGYNTGVINAPQKVIEAFINETNFKRTGESMGQEQVTFIWSTAVAIFAVGGMVGSLSAGFFANYLGRKKSMLANNLIAFVGAALMGFSKMANSYEMLIIGRLIIGINCGLNTGFVPLYLSEIAPFNLRGGIGVLNQVGVASGILLSQIFGLPVVLGTEKWWPLLLGLTAIPAVYQLIVLPFCPESPRYLLITKNEEEASRKSLEWFRKDTDVAADMAEMKREYEEETKERRITILELLKKNSLRRPLVISIVMQLSQQLSGINAVLYYSTSIFISAGVEPDIAPYVTLSTGGAIALMALVTVPLMDHAGRKTLHMLGLGLMFIFAVILTIFLNLQTVWAGSSYISILSVMLFVVAFGLGPASIPWLFVAELFSQGPRPAAVSVAFMVNWMANFVVGLLFPLMQDGLGYYVFLIFAAFLVVFFLFTWKFVPETKNKSFEEISALFKSKSQRDHEANGTKNVYEQGGLLAKNC